MSLREFLSGPLPYDAYPRREDLAARLTANKCAVRPIHLEFPVHVPETLRRIVRKASRVEPNERYQSADAMVDQLLRVRFVDWSWPLSDAGATVWTGRWLGDEFRVTTRAVRGKGWRARAERRHASGWRKVQGVEDVDSSDAEAAAAAAFSQIDVHLFRD
jgi:hypothetical protein